ncbi:adenylyl-sulfate kinase [Dyadobacter arcticus]|uniref:Adenylyl-sulfate kinase n=1 Tax=Dyadobacter arcticus TaxID=1078754 RepID=A0ABX0UKX8_9BACT|nr:adenylyl-sulfate kinase [Dyadobacter arcticus]NIJ52330.1 adenylylsulfate kinase [Dyadobacter arcticus]
MNGGNLENRSLVSFQEKKEVMMQEPILLWLTGLSGSGKSTLAYGLEHYLFHEGFKTVVLDGDNLRNGLCSDLGFTPDDRKENIRRLGEVASLMLNAGLIVICATISPYGDDRLAVQAVVGSDRFFLVYVYCDLLVCEKRDVKGLYKKARNGSIQHFRGITAPYEPPKQFDIQVDTGIETGEESLAKIIQAFEMRIRYKY